MKQTIVLSKLDQENQDYISQLISSGIHNSELEVVQEAIIALREKQQNQRKIEQFNALIAQGEKSIAQGKVFDFSEELIDQAFEQAQKNIKAGKPIKDAVKPYDETQDQ